MERRRHEREDVRVHRAAAAGRRPRLSVREGSASRTARQGSCSNVRLCTEVLSNWLQLFDKAPGRLHEVAERAFLENRHAIDMDSCVEPLTAAMDVARL